MSRSTEPAIGKYVFAPRRQYLVDQLASPLNAFSAATSLSYPKMSSTSIRGVELTNSMSHPARMQFYASELFFGERCFTRVRSCGVERIHGLTIWCWRLGGLAQCWLSSPTRFFRSCF